MQLAFVLYKYFPFGGLQRDFMRIALECQKRGHQIRVYTLIWEGVLAGILPAWRGCQITPAVQLKSH